MLLVQCEPRGWQLSLSPSSFTWPLSALYDQWLNTLPVPNPMGLLLRMTEIYFWPWSKLRRLTCHHRKRTFWHLGPQSPQEKLLGQNWDHFKLSGCEKGFRGRVGKGGVGDVQWDGASFTAVLFSIFCLGWSLRSWGEHRYSLEASGHESKAL